MPPMVVSHTALTSYLGLGTPVRHCARTAATDIESNKEDMMRENIVIRRCF